MSSLTKDQMITRPITERLQMQAERLARKRNDNKAKNNVPSQKVDEDKTEEEAHVIGAIGELAVRRVYGFSINKVIRPSGDNGWDLQHKGLDVEVKTREEEGKDFAMYNNHDDLEADIGILCWVTDEVTIVGWVSRPAWMIAAGPLNFGDELRRGVEWGSMTDPRWLNKLGDADGGEARPQYT